MDDVTTYYLEMHSLGALRDKPDPMGLTLWACRIPQFQFNRFLYQFVGQGWEWTDRLAWSDDQWRLYVEDAATKTWVAYGQGAIAGYFELRCQARGEVEIAYFGLTPHFIGRGVGGYLLAAALKAAWALGGTRRVWLHTCTLDHPHALANYRARGMTVYRTETSPRRAL